MKKMAVILVAQLFLLAHPSASQVGCTLPNNLFARDTLVICQDTAFVLALPNYPGAQFSWSTSSTDSSTLISKTGLYRVKVSSGSCTITDSIYLLFNSLIQAPNAEDNLICVHRPSPPLFARGNALLWYDEAIGGKGSAQPIIPKTDSIGVFYYYVSQQIQGCESPRTQIKVEVIDKPSFDLGKNILVPCNLDGIVLQVVPENYTQYTWWDGTPGPVYQARKAGRYILRAENICGNHTDTVLTVDCKAKCVSIPNAFTPNGDGLNDFFRASTFCPLEKFKLMIFNRFGEKVFETNNPQQAWDGRYSGKLLPTGAFTYYCLYTDFVLKQDLLQKGTVTILH